MISAWSVLWRLMNFIGIKRDYWIMVVTQKHECHWMFWMPNIDRYTRSKWKIFDMVLTHRRLRLREIVKAITHDSAVSILNDHLVLKKLSPRYEPHSFTINHKRSHVNLRRGVWGSPTTIRFYFFLVDQTWTLQETNSSRNSEFFCANQFRKRSRWFCQ